MAGLPDDQIRALLQTLRRVAVVGISPDPHRASHAIAKYLMSQGYDVVGVRPETQQVLGRPTYPTLLEVPGEIEIVDVFRAPEFVPEVIRQAIQRKAKLIWLQEGVTHPEAEKMAADAGIPVVSDRCIYKERKRLKLPPLSV